MLSQLGRFCSGTEEMCAGETEEKLDFTGFEKTQRSASAFQKVSRIVIPILIPQSDPFVQRETFSYDCAVGQDSWTRPTPAPFFSTNTEFFRTRNEVSQGVGQIFGNLTFRRTVVILRRVQRVFRCRITGQPPMLLVVVVGMRSGCFRRITARDQE